MMKVHDPPPAAAAHGRLTQALCLIRRGFAARAYALALGLHDQARRDGDDLLRAECADCLVYCCILLARFEQGVRFARTACAVWQARGEARRGAATGGRLAMLLGWLGEPDALDEADAALAAAEREADRDSASWAILAQALTHSMLHQPDRAAELAEQAAALAEEPRTAIMASAGVAEALALQGMAGADGPERRARLDRALELTRGAIALGRAAGDASLERILINNVAEYSLYAGDAAGAEAALAEFACAAGEAPARAKAHHRLLRARLLMSRGRHEEAVETLHACGALIPSDDMELGPMRLLDLCDAQAALGRFEAALEAHRAYHAQHVRRASEAALRRARLSALRVEAEELRRDFVKARELADRLLASNEMLAREAERLLRTTLEDPLTGLANRRRLDVALLDLLAAGAPFALAMVDLDHFKRVNDRFSHPVGDAVLREFASLAAASCRKEDLAVRYGGEEFALLLAGADLAAAVPMFERLRARVEAHDWGRIAPGLSITASFGVADFVEAQSGESLVAVADRRLYEAKRRGRNQLVWES